MKLCPRCLIWKPLVEFRQSKGKAQCYCAPCHRDYKSARAAERRGGKPWTKGPASGKPLSGPRPDDVRERFMVKVEKMPDGHWMWRSAYDDFGYGRFSIKGDVYPAHRVSLWLSGVDVPALCVDHTCQIRGCVNPAHLRIVTPTISAIENNESSLARNRRKTHCIRGHELSGANIIWMPGRGPKGSPVITRVCIICRPTLRNNPRQVPQPAHRKDLT